MSFLGIATKGDLLQVNKNAAINYNNQWGNVLRIRKLGDRIYKLELKMAAQKKPKRSVK